VIFNQDGVQIQKSKVKTPSKTAFKTHPEQRIPSPCPKS